MTIRIVTRYQTSPRPDTASAIRRSRAVASSVRRITNQSTTPIRNTAIAVSSRVESARNTQTYAHRQLRRVAFHQANSSGVITSASGWKLAHAIHCTGAYIRYT